MGTIGKKLALIIGVPFGVSITLYAGSAVMGQICSYSFGIPMSQEWLEKSSTICQLFSDLSQLIMKITNSI